MIIDCVSDLHGYEPDLPGGDLLLLAGDYTASGLMVQWGQFFAWLKKQPYRKKILIAGNHDNFFESGFPMNQKEADELKEVQQFLGEEEQDFEYLCDSGTEFEDLKIWGTPWTHLFQGVNPKCTSFMRSEEFLAEKFQLIPEGLDILITHGPPYEILDQNRYKQSCGSPSLKEALLRAKPKFHVFGHIHEQGGKAMYVPELKREWTCTVCANCSCIDENYDLARDATRKIWV